MASDAENADMFGGIFDQEENRRQEAMEVDAPKADPPKEGKENAAKLSLAERLKNVTTRRKEKPKSSGPVAVGPMANRELTIEENESIELIDSLQGQKQMTQKVMATLGEQSARLEQLVIDMRQYAGERIFADHKLLDTPMDSHNPYFCANVFAILEDKFKEAFKKFNTGTELITTNFIELCLDVFLEQYDDPPRTISLFLRFMAIAIAAGVDRALYALQKKDRLMRSFDISLKEDVYFGKQCLDPTHSLNRSRGMYYGCFRRDGWKPPVMTTQSETRVDPEESDQQKELDYWKKQQEARKKRAEEGRGQHGSLANFSSEKSGSSQAYKPILKKSPYPYMAVPASKRASFGEQDQDNIRVYASGQDGIRVTSGDDSDTEEEGEVSRANPPPSKPVHEQVRDAQRDMQAETSSDDESKPAIPVHIAENIPDPYFNVPLTKEGRVFNPNDSYREIPPKPSGVWERTIQGLANSGCKPEQIENILSTSAAISQVATMLTSDYKKKNIPTYEEVPPPPKKMDLSTDSFNYDINGRSISEVLGKRFCKTRFPSEPVRKMVMRGILQKIVDHPKSSYTARMIAVGQLGKDDPLIRGRAEIHALMNDTLEAECETEDVISPPRLGKNSLTNEVLKSLLTRLGLSPGERYELEDLTLVQLKNFWMNLKEVITAYGLREKEAYALLRRLLKGNSSDQVWLAEQEHRIPFIDYWISKQKTQKRVVSTSEFKKKLEHLISKEPAENLERTLNQILILNDKIFQKEADASVRKLLCQRATLKDFRAYLRNHYSPYLSQINTAFIEKQKALAIKKNMPSFTNELIYTPGLTYAFLEVCSEVLADVEPDAPRERYYHNNNNDRGHFNKGRARIHAIEASPQEEPKKKVEEDRDATREPERQNRKFPNKSGPGPRGPYKLSTQRAGSVGNNNNNNNNNNGSNNRQWPRQQNFRYNCHLCGELGHSFRRCELYPGENPGDKKCQVCSGQHVSACKNSPKQNGGRKGSNFNSQIMEIRGAPGSTDDQSRRQPNNYGPPNNFGPRNGFTPGNSNGYMPPRQDGYGPRHGGNNYNGGYNRGYGPNRPDNRNYNGNFQGRPDFQGYQGNDQRPFNSGRPNFRGGPRSNKSGYRSGGPDRYPNQGNNQGSRRQDGGQQKMDQRHISQLEEMLKSMKQQKMTEHVPEGQNYNGLGNGGHQPLNSSVVIDAMEQYFGSDSQ